MEHKYQGGRKPKPPKESHTQFAGDFAWLCATCDHLSMRQVRLLNFKSACSPSTGSTYSPRQQLQHALDEASHPHSAQKYQEKKHVATVLPADLRPLQQQMTESHLGQHAACSSVASGLGRWLLAHRQWPGSPACLSITPPLKPGSYSFMHNLS